MSATLITEKASAEAGAWLARIHAGDLSEQDQAALQVWLAANPAHAAAFEHGTSVWEQLGAIPRDFYVSKKKEPLLLNRRALLAAAAGIVIVGSGIPFLRGAQARSYRSAVGEQKRVALEDGSQLFLDTDTSLTVDFSGSQRLVDLKQGRINCRVAQNDRPFAANSGNWVVIGNHSVFDVVHSPQYSSVVLIDGNAQVKNSTNSSIELRQGDRIIATQSNLIQRDRPDLSILTAWQSGHLIFKDEPVSSVVEEVNRYSKVKIEVGDTKVASMRMSGGYVVGDTTGFAESLSQLLPVEVRVTEGKIKLVSKQNI